MTREMQVAGDGGRPNEASFDSSHAADAARQIWLAGVSAVDSAKLVRNAVHRDGNVLEICGQSYDLDSLSRLIVVGAGKASAGMARGLEAVLGCDILESRVAGWINVPADCVVPTQRIHLHAARPAGRNEPTEEGVFGSRQIMNLVRSMQERDVCLVLLSGGGSALLPLPVDGVSLSDKQAVTRYLSQNGATIHELNCVRKRLSLIKGGGLLRAPSAGRMIAMIISDVVGDPLDVIASGPTVCDPRTAADAISVLEHIQGVARAGAKDPHPLEIPSAIWNELRRQSATGYQQSEPVIACRNVIIGNNETALNAAVSEAERLGFEVHSLGSQRQGFANLMGQELAERCLAARQSGLSRPVCWIGGGEPVVQLAPTDRPRKGGRNQEVALAALCRLWDKDLQGIAILSGGTDGEDGPTDAAGAVCSKGAGDQAKSLAADPFDALSFNDSYTFFNRVNSLLKTGPTHTNVMDLQVAVVYPVV